MTIWSMVATTCAGVVASIFGSRRLTLFNGKITIAWPLHSNTEGFAQCHVKERYLGYCTSEKVLNFKVI